MSGPAGRKRDWLELRLKHLRGLLPRPLEVGLPGEDDWAGVVGPRGTPRLLLGTFSVEEVRDALERFGILTDLKARGLCEPRVEIDTQDPLRQTLKVNCSSNGGSCCVAETALRLDLFETDAPFARPLHGQRLQMLYILWLLMQNPAAAFTPQRPALPGQEHPGLGIGRQVEQVYLALARRLGVDGIVNSPEFGHTAVLYSRYYRFLDPEAEGRLIALRRDLAALSLAEASWALHTGCIIQEGDPPCIFRWVPEEQILPLREPLLSFFRSRAYVKAVTRSAAAHRFRFDAERFARISPLNDDGTPRVLL